MSSSNRVSLEISAAESAAISAAIEQLKTALKPLLIVNLTAEERRFSLKMGDKTLAFVGKTLSYASHTPEILPNYVDLDEAKIDYKLSSEIHEISQQLSTLQAGLEDTEMVVGGEAYEAALVIYHSVKGAGRFNVPGVQAIYDDLKQRFPGRGKSINTPQ